MILTNAFDIERELESSIEKKPFSQHQNLEMNTTYKNDIRIIVTSNNTG